MFATVAGNSDTDFLLAVLVGVLLVLAIIWFVRHL